MTDFQITDADLAKGKFEGKVAVVTGGSSGIGLATLTLLASLGATVVTADINPPPTALPPRCTYTPTDVTQWSSLTALFKSAVAEHGRIDYVFANAGIGPRANYVALETDAQGELVRPASATLDVNLGSVMETASLAVHYMKTQESGGSLVLMGSSTSLHGVRAIDYATAKSGVLGFGRGLAVVLEAAKLPVRLNMLAPSWTVTQVLPDLGNLLKAVDYEAQSAEAVARAAVYLLGDGERHGDVVFVGHGKYREIEKAIMRPAYLAVKGDGPSDDEVLAKILALEG
ncbi:hypothetical protein C7974DRAFT_370108 [Boeremia exigua]|uniref:uncharacterized protein n=1 Tax=Boeremia exigua TaxID=749465 RepID=UPI001E8D97C3|nr:uncharacterized protein C7974DRAFT_370108 [Boeremia exigua]KAH6611916.1 hypothetical protein C7974DRAFT_370108 [Boeremia exigua]